MTPKTAAIIAALREAGATGRRVPGIHSTRGQEESMRRFRVTVDGQPYEVSVEEMQEPVPAAEARHIQAPMPGRILEVRVGSGTSVSPDSVVVVLEAMKMENDIVAGSGGKIAAVHVQAGDAVNTGDLLIEME